MSSLYDAALAPLGINIAQFSLLKRIDHAEPISLTELARLIDLDRSTVGRNVRVLERLGLVETRTGEDQRESAAALTAEGRDVFRRAAPLWDACQSEIEARIGAAGLDALKRIARVL